jgi:hypothetical protein
MKIGIDISQIVYEGTGVSKYVREIVRHLISLDQKNDYILFGSSLRKKQIIVNYVDELKQKYPHVTLQLYSFPPIILDIIWNRLHIFPIEWLIGKVDVFWSSDWSQPPLGTAKGITTIHDLIIYKYPQETANTISFDIRSLLFKANIVETQKRRLKRAQQECNLFLCDSESTKQDCQEILQIPEHKIRVIYPGFNL